MDATDRLLDESGPWAAGLIGDEAAMAPLRAALAALGLGLRLTSLDDHAVLALAQALLRAGREATPVRMHHLVTSAAAAAPAPAGPARAASSPRAAPAAEPEVAAEPGALAPDVDAAGLATALRAAANDGVPFVEECTAHG